jgi:hypothetical protein
MDEPNVLVTFLPTVIAVLATVFAGLSAWAGIRQTGLQRKIHQDATQPYVWVDIRPDSKEPNLHTVVVGNSGPTFATNVRATFDPPLPTGTLRGGGRDEAASRRLREGLPSLAPGRQFTWPLGFGEAVLGPDESRRYTITIDANGPYGPLPRQCFDVDIHSYRETLDSPDGSLHKVRMAIEKVATAVEKSKHN